MGEPARGYSWPQFEPGNQVGRQFEPGNRARELHGARSPRTLQPVADGLVDELVAVAPWTARPVHTAAVRAWAIAEAECLAYRRWFSDMGLFTAESEPRPGIDKWQKAEARAANLRERLGLDPLSLARLLAAFGQAATAGTGQLEGVERVEAEGRAIVEARLAQLAASAPQDGSGVAEDSPPDHGGEDHAAR